MGGGLVTALHRERPDLSRLAGEDEVVTSVGAFATTTHPLPPVDPVQSGWDITRCAPGPQLALFAAGFWVLCAAAVVAVLGAVLSQRRPVAPPPPAGGDRAQDNGGVVGHVISGFDEDDPVFPERPASGAAG
ncbi:hypothetical protein [Actinosynnema sp.]|uniref:hypothetical protein n=1 Tax=Actinosynnema sp. TaxID=1872144 RepID=UPI003F856CA2